MANLDDFLMSLTGGADPTKLSTALQGTIVPREYQEDILNMLVSENRAPADVGKSVMVTNLQEQKEASEKEGQRVVFLGNTEPATLRASITEPQEVVHKSIQDGFMNINSTLELINKEPDLTKRRQLLVDLQASTGDLIAQATKEARQAAEQSLGVTDIKKQLAEAEALDKQDPLYNQYRTDSKITASIRSKLMQAESGIDRQSAQLIRENGPLQRLIKTVDSTLSLQDALMQRELNRAEGKAAKDSEKLDFIATIPDEVKEDLIKRNPNLQNDLAAGLLSYVAKGSTKDKESYMRLYSGNVTRQNYLSEGLDGNEPARDLAIIAQADKTGLPVQTVAGMVRNIERFVNDPTFFEEQAKNLQLLNPTQLKKYKASLITKEGSEQASQTRKALVEAYAQHVNRSYVDNNITQWNASLVSEDGTTYKLETLPGAQTIIERLQKVHGKNPTIHQFASAFVNDETVEMPERIARSNAVNALYMQALKKAGGGIFGKIDTIQELTKMEVRQALEAASLAAKTGQIVGQGVSTALRPFEQFGRLQRETGTAMFNTAQDFYKGLTGEVR